MFCFFCWELRLREAGWFCSPECADEERNDEAVFDDEDLEPIDETELGVGD